ncbi:MAG: hypothetical protein Q7S52_03005 [bacterium]|nr:hypothetical protein [bacterium]
MTKWIILISFVVAGIVLGYSYKNLGWDFGNPQGPISVPATESVGIVHSFKDGIHRYAGEIRLPHSCYSVAVDARRDIRNPAKVLVTLMTRDDMTGDLRFCLKIPTRYPFETIAEAPEDAPLTLTIDGKETPTRIIETPWHDPRGTILNLENIN